MILLALQLDKRPRTLFLARLLPAPSLLVKVDGFAIPLALLRTVLVECAPRRMRRNQILASTAGRAASAVLLALLSKGAQIDLCPRASTSIYLPWRSWWAWSASFIGKEIID